MNQLCRAASSALGPGGRLGFVGVATGNESGNEPPTNVEKRFEAVDLVDGFPTD
jgi:hypothetical protein